MPTLAKTSSSIKKFPVVLSLLLVKITYAESAIISSILLFATAVSPPNKFLTADVDMDVLGHKALTAH